ncbi:MAG: DegV family protein [Burkholderiales bacterium]
MNKVKVITDSTSDLPYSLMQERGIDMVPLHIILGDRSFPDDHSLSNKDLFLYADKFNVLPKSAAVNEYQFTETFKKWLDQGYDILFIGISSKLSATVQNAITAASELNSERISVIDSLSLSTGIGLQVLEAADMADQGASLKEITEYILAIRSSVQASFVVDTLKYLYMGGRCSRLVSIMGSRLKIKPKLELINGEIVPTVKFRGSNFVRKYYNQLMEKADEINPKRIFITHCLSKNAEELKNLLETEHGFKNVFITDASPTISVHCGPGTIGILYIKK